jgi:hypothetical protein
MAVLCAFVLVPGTPDLYAQPMSRDASPQAQQAPKIPSDQLDSLVAPEDRGQRCEECREKNEHRLEL